jgi:hypothetical protein
MHCVYVWGYQYIFNPRFLRHFEITLISKYFILPRLIMDIVIIHSVFLLKHSIIIIIIIIIIMSVFSCSITWLHLLIVTVLRKSHTNFKLTKVNLGCAIYSQSQSMPDVYCYVYRYAPHNDVPVNDGPHIRRWSHKVKIL